MSGRLKNWWRAIQSWLRASRRRRTLLTVVAGLLMIALLLVAIGWFFAFCRWGLFRENNPYTLFDTPVSANDLRMQYDGTEYRVDADVVNILILGVDDVDEDSPGWNESLARGGQADTLVLCSYNLRTNKAVLLPLSRQLVVPLGIPSSGGNSIAFQTEGPLCLAHAYGSTPQQSAQLTMAAVSYLFYGIPIHRFVSMKMDAVRHITDFVGGVTVVALADFYYIAGVEDGTDILLDGEMAELFVRGRSMGHQTGRDLDRMVRQRLYVFALIDVVREKTQRNPFFVLDLYRETQPYITTDLTFREMGNLAGGLLLQNGEIALEVMTGDETDQVYVPENGWIKQFVRTYCMQPVG